MRGLDMANKEQSKLTRLVAANGPALEEIRDALWESGEEQLATQIDRLISKFHPDCQP